MKEIIFLMPQGSEDMIPTAPAGLPDGPVKVSVVNLDLNKIDQIWKQDLCEYSGKSGYDRKEKKIENIKKGVLNSGEVHMPIIFLPAGEANGLTFVDGRHTTAYLHEEGYEKAQFVVPLVQRELIREAFS